ncbi:hypothetical protein JCM19046_3057 [Bacillus sp. JCM 19046]|nr:hypothetical protein JCM19045_346 [Bacillus sp. JCM 19045]GAF18480.1 hypothetical protein JCM19046_3057 [Bacillus sp. JCM 19046]
MEMTFKKLRDLEEKPLYIDGSSDFDMTYLIEREDAYVIVTYKKANERKEVLISKEELSGYNLRFFQESANQLFVFVFIDVNQCLSIHTYTKAGTKIHSFTIKNYWGNCYLLDEHDRIWIGLGDVEIFDDENSEGICLFCYELDGTQRFAVGDNDFVEIQAPLVADSYALTQYKGSCYLLYYNDLNIVSFKDNQIKKAWILEETIWSRSGPYIGIGIYEGDFWVHKTTHEIYRFPSIPNGEMEQIIPTEEGEPLLIEGIHFSKKGIYLYANQSIYVREIEMK